MIDAEWAHVLRTKAKNIISDSNNIKHIIYGLRYTNRVTNKPVEELSSGDAEFILFEDDDTFNDYCNRLNDKYVDFDDLIIYAVHK